MFTRVVYPISPYRESCAIGLCLLRLDHAYKLAVFDVFHLLFGYFMLVDELDGVGWIFNASSHSIGKQSKFVC